MPRWLSARVSKYPKCLSAQVPYLCKCLRALNYSVPEYLKYLSALRVLYEFPRV